MGRIDTRELEKTLASLEDQCEAALADSVRKAKDAQRARGLLKSRTISEAQVYQDLAAAGAAKEQARSLENQTAAECSLRLPWWLPRAWWTPSTWPASANCCIASSTPDFILGSPCAALL